MQSIQDSVLRMAFIALVVAGCLSGCRDNPNNRSARDIHSQSREAVAAVAKPGAYELDKDGRIVPVDLASLHEQSRRRIQNVLQKSRGSADASSTAALVSGDLAFNQAAQMRFALVQWNPPIQLILNEVHRKSLEMGRLELDREQLRFHIQSADQLAEQLVKLIDSGEGGAVSLKDQLASAEQQLGEIQERRAERVKIRDEAQKVVNDLQARADAFLKQADSVSGDEMLKLQQQGYDLLLSKKNHYIEFQNTADQIGRIDGEIAIVQPHVENLRSQIQSLQNRIRAIQGSEEVTAAKTQIAEIEKQIAQCHQRIRSLLGELRTTLEKYSSSVTAILAVFDHASKDYQSARSREIANYSLARIANLHYETARTLTESMEFQSMVLQRIMSLSEFIPPDMADDATGMTTILTKSIADQGAIALDRFDQSAASYEQLASGASGRGKQFALDVARERLLALYGKRQLAERMNKAELVEAASAKAKEIMDPLIQQDPTFAQTVTAQLFTGLQGYTPQMAIDIDLYYEGVVRQFQNWRKLKGPDAEAEVNKLLASLEDMSKKESPALMDKLKPEWDALKAAKDKGFAVDETAGDPNTPSIQPLMPRPPR